VKDTQKAFWALLIIALFLTVSSGSNARAQGMSGASAEVNQAVQSSRNNDGIMQALDRGRVDGARLKNKAALKAFYLGRDYKAAWLGGAFFGSSSKAQGIVEVLENAWRHGMNPDVYHLKELKAALSSGETLPKGYDVLLTDAAIEYAQDITAMRVEAKSLKLHSRYWREAIDPLVLLSNMTSLSDPATALKDLAPSGKLYRMLQNELEKLYTTPITDEETLVDFKGILRPGRSHKAVASLRQRMGLEASVNAPNFYDDALAAAVMKFQRDNGLGADGVLGPQTLSVLNKTRDQRINQVLVNMERLRWLDQDRPDSYVVVNVPAARLWAIEDNQIAFDMKVVVGRNERQTNIFNTEITGIRFNPTWTVPPTIKAEDFLPNLRANPLYLANRGIEVVQGGQSIDPTLVDWNGMSDRELHGFQMVQPPGRANPLGRFRVFMPNPYNIYLHDTNKRSYFNRTDRALSSGCIRMEDAEKFAYFVMKHNEGWSEEKMQAIMKSGKKTDIMSQVRIPVYLLYQTIWLGDSGELVYGHDIYARDIALRRALNDISGVGYPENMQVAMPKIPKQPRKVKKAKRLKRVATDPVQPIEEPLQDIPYDLQQERQRTPERNMRQIRDERVVIEPARQISRERPSVIVDEIREAPEAVHNRGSLTVKSNIGTKIKKKEGIDLLTFNE